MDSPVIGGGFRPFGYLLGFETCRSGPNGIAARELNDTNIGVSIFCPGLVTPSIRTQAVIGQAIWPTRGSKPSPEAQAQERKLRNDPEYAMDAFETGRIVLQGMRNNDLYILTHSEFEQIMWEARLASARSWWYESIYAIESERKRRDGCIAP